MGADILAMQGVKTSTTMIFTMLNRINSSPHVNVLIQVNQYGTFINWFAIKALL